MPMLSGNLGNGGRLGNKLFGYAALIGMAEKHGHELSLPDWGYCDYFEQSFPIGELKGYEYQETTFHYNEDYVNGLKDIECDFNLKGYFQSLLYWQHCEYKVKAALKFKPDFIDQVKQPFEDVFDKSVIAISVRRGDYLGNPNYHCLPISHYIHALFEHFPDWEQYNIVVFSDDIPYCRVHFDCLENVYFSENNSDIEDICLMSLCTHFLVANSTFSWFGAYLGEKPGSKIIHSVHHFEGELKRKNDSSTYYPAHWIPFDYSGKKLDITNTTFTIPVFYDHPDRKQNLDLSVCLIQHYFDTNIIVQENKSKGLDHISEYVDYWQSDHEQFHRTKMLNEMASIAKTDIIINWDADVVIAPLQIWKAVQAIRNGADMIYPYDGRFARIPRLVWFQKLQHWTDIGIVGDTKFNGMNSNDNFNSVGGAVVWNRTAFLKIGGENENFISFGAEDTERLIRAQTMEFQIDRIKGPLYHINHWIGVNSSTRNPWFMHNRIEFEKVKDMNKEELSEYIESWKR